MKKISQPTKSQLFALEMNSEKFRFDAVLKENGLTLNDFDFDGFDNFNFKNSEGQKVAWFQIGQRGKETIAWIK